MGTGPDWRDEYPVHPDFPWEMNVIDRMSLGLAYVREWPEVCIHLLSQSDIIVIQTKLRAMSGGKWYTWICHNNGYPNDMSNAVSAFVKKVLKEQSSAIDTEERLSDGSPKYSVEEQLENK